jgi:predicted DNA binding CopG/RHH family protein
MTDTKGIYVRFPKELIRAIKVAAATRDMTLQDWMTEAVSTNLPAAGTRRNGDIASAG